MTSLGEYADVTVDIGDDYVANVTIHRPPNNFFDYHLIASLTTAFADIDDDSRCRAILLSSEGKHFCAGADFAREDEERVDELYREAVKLFAAKTPVVAAVQGAAVGGGLGLAMMADFRVAAPEARFSANFSLLGYHHGFGLTATLPRVVGHQTTLDLLYTGRRVKGSEALALGLCDEFAPARRASRRSPRPGRLRSPATGPLALRAIRETMRGDLAALVRAATDREVAEQNRPGTHQRLHRGCRGLRRASQTELHGHITARPHNSTAT